MGSSHQPESHGSPDSSWAASASSEFPVDPELLKRLEEYGQSLARGQPVDKDKLLAGYPQIAGQLSAYLGALEFVHAAFAGESSPLRDSAGEGAGNLAPLARRRLGDYVLLAERGRGGMGVVYEAEQQSLHRRVAVKVLLAAAALSANHLQRFKNEALAAASLDHPHIVKVYSIGCDRGVHYYAMQYVEGQSLAEVIQTLQREQPAPALYQHFALLGMASSEERMSASPCLARREYLRFVVRLGIQAAEALEYAHHMGIIHRDIKPSNLLLDLSGRLWVTDFGLALRRTVSELTLTGDVVGTLRYMSPEQALGRRHLLGQATDLYSLGGTLYELLSLRPPFPEEDPQELLQRLAAHDPPPVRRLNTAVPRDLETIVMKCLAKEPLSRYVSAQALADDLRRFLDDRPILARRPTVAARLAKWSRRHMPIVYSAVVILLLVFVGLIAATWRISRERDHARQSAERARQMAEVADQQRQLADSEHGRADANFQKAREAVDRLVRRAAREMADQPHMERVRRALLEDALEFYQGFLAQKSGDLVVSRETALAYYQVGYIQVLLGQYQACLPPLQQACRMLEELMRRDPRDVQLRLDLAEPYDQCAYAMMWASRDQEAISYRRKRLALFEQVRKEFPRSLRYLRLAASAYSDLGVMLDRAGRPAEGIEQFRQALALCDQECAAFPEVPPDRMLLGHIHHWLGTALEDTGRLSEAETHYRTAYQLRTETSAEEPQNVKGKHLLGHATAYLASLLLNTGRTVEGERLLRQALAIDEQLLSQFPHTADYRRRAGIDYHLLGRFLFSVPNRRDEAEAALRRCVAIDTGMVADLPGVTTYLAQLTSARYDLAAFLDANGRSAEAAGVCRTVLADFEAAPATQREELGFQFAFAQFLVTCPLLQFRDPVRAVQLLQPLVHRRPQDPLCWAILGLAYYRSGDAVAALDAVETAMKLSKGGEARIWLGLAMIHRRLGHCQQSRSWYQKAAAWIDKNHPFDESYARFRAEAEQVMENVPLED